MVTPNVYGYSSSLNNIMSVNAPIRWLQFCVRRHVDTPVMHISRRKRNCLTWQLKHNWDPLLQYAASVCYRSCFLRNFPVVSLIVIYPGKVSFRLSNACPSRIKCIVSTSICLTNDFNTYLALVGLSSLSVTRKLFFCCNLLWFVQSDIYHQSNLRPNHPWCAFYKGNVWLY